jgi:hypothetical protein
MGGQTVSSPQGQRILPNLPAAAYTSFTILAPLTTHFRRGTCEEARCAHYLAGWRSIVDERSQLGQAQAYYIRRESGRRFREEQLSPAATVFTFEPGQACFKSDTHRVRVQRPEIYVARGGDWRGNPTGYQVRHSAAADWVDQFATNQDNLATIIQRG